MPASYSAEMPFPGQHDREHRLRPGTAGKNLDDRQSAAIAQHCPCGTASVTQAVSAPARIAPPLPCSAGYWGWIQSPAGMQLAPGATVAGWISLVYRSISLYIFFAFRKLFSYRL